MPIPTFAIERIDCRSIQLKMGLNETELFRRATRDAKFKKVRIVYEEVNLIDMDLEQELTDLVVNHIAKGE